MKRFDSHLLALRGARRVTATVARSTVRWSLGIALAASSACSTAKDGATVDAVGNSDSSGLLSDILGTEVASADSTDGATDSEAADSTSDATDAVDSEDDGTDATDGSADATDGTDGSDGSDGSTDVTDGSTDMTDGDSDTVVVLDPDVYETHGADGSEADTVSHGDDFGVQDVAENDLGADQDVSEDAGTVLPATCYIPTDIACVTYEDCAASEKPTTVCVDGLCNDQDLSSEVAQACCNAQYEAGNFGVPGCNPWGPPAPPVDRGFRLRDFAAARQVA